MNITLKLKIATIFLLCMLTAKAMFSQFAVFNPAEFEKNEGLLMTWAYEPGLDTLMANITKVAQQTAKVWISYNPENTAVDTIIIRDFILSQGASFDNLFFIPALNETSWIRDFGPNVLYGNFGQGNQRYLLDMRYSGYGRPNDDSFPAQLSGLWGWTRVDLDLEAEGGNLLFDGLTRGFATTRIQQQNPELSASMIQNMLIDKFNLMDFTFLQSLTNSGGGNWQHADMFMKVLDYETLLVSSYPDSLPYHNILEFNIMILEGLSNHFNKPYRIIRIPAPPKADGTFAISQNDEMRTYTNSLIINNTIIVPSYGISSYDDQAAQIYTEAMPGYKIIMVDARYISQINGGIRRITKEVPAPLFMRIIHRKVTGVQEYSPEMYLYSNCESNSGIQGMWLYYKVNDEEKYNKVPVYMACPQNIGIIENLKPGDKVSYYLEGVSAGGATMTYPGGAPAANFTFWYESVVGNESIIAHRSDLRLIPISNTGNFILSGSNLPETGIIQVIDLSGQLLYQANVHANSVIDSNLKAGVYIVNFLSGNSRFTSKLLVVN